MRSLLRVAETVGCKQKEKIIHIIFYKKDEMQSMKLNSKGGLLNPKYFKSFWNQAIEFQLDMDKGEKVIEYVYDKGTNQNNFEKTYITLLLSIISEHPQYGILHFKVRMYENQLVEILKKIESEELQDGAKFYIQLTKLNGYEWYKAKLFYDKELTKEIGQNTTGVEADKYLKKRYKN